MMTAEMGGVDTFGAPDNTDLLEEFVGYQQAIAGVKPKRALELRRALGAYSEWLGGELVDATQQDLSNYAIYLIREQKLAASSATLYLKAIKAFYNWAFYQREVISAERLLRIRRVSMPKGPPDVPRPYNRNELWQFWYDLDERWPLRPERAVQYWMRGHTKNFGSKMKRHAMRLQVEAIVHLALHCGLRRLEIFQLTLDDIHPDNSYIPVKGKGDRERQVPIDPTTRATCNRWLRLRATLNPPHSSPWLSLWGQRRSDPMSWDAFIHIMPGIGKGYRMHRFRHTCATERLRAGMPLENLRRFLGHTDIKQTLGYAQLLHEDVAKAAERSDEPFLKSVHRPSTVPIPQEIKR